MIETLTAENRVRDFEIPSHVKINGELIELPKSLTKKDVHFIYNKDKEVIKAAWINKALASILLAITVESKELREYYFSKATIELDDLISQLIKEEVLRNRKGPGAMSMAQSHEVVPEGSILLSERTYEQLVKSSPRWKNVTTVTAIRFPNLGPNTTQRLKVIINSDKKPPSLTSIGARFPSLAELLDPEEKEVVETNILDAFYLNPKDLKDGFQGDGDGRHNCR